MRPLKFRARDMKKNQWLHNYPSLGGCSILGEIMVLGAWVSGVSLKDLNEIIVNQYTGIDDAKGKEIYEGDIFKAPHDFGPGGWQERIASVSFNKTLGYQWHYWNLNKIVVIGNIYETPELLESA